MSDTQVDYVDTQDHVVGTGSLATVQSTFQPHRWFFVFIYNDAGEILMLHRSEVHETSPNCWDVSCEGPVTAGEDYPSAARRTLEAQLGIPAETVPLRPFAKIPAGLDNSKRFIQLYTCGPLNGPFSPATEEFAQLAFARPEDVDALVESSHGEVAECLRIAWRFRSELAAQLANPGKIVEAPAPVQTTTTVPVPIASVPPPY
ncbi:MAG: NUDIX domain-containing protein, partial [Candidatus Methylacidiphilales bacterium]